MDTSLADYRWVPHRFSSRFSRTNRRFRTLSVVNSPPFPPPPHPPTTGSIWSLPHSKTNSAMHVINPVGASKVTAESRQMKWNRVQPNSTRRNIQTYTKDEIEAFRRRCVDIKSDCVITTNHNWQRELFVRQNWSPICAILPHWKTNFAELTVSPVGPIKWRQNSVECSETVTNSVKLESFPAFTNDKGRV